MPRAPREPILRYLAANVRRARKRLDLTQEGLAESLKLKDERYIQRIEAGTVNIGLVMLAKLASALSVTPGSLLRKARLPPSKRGRPEGSGSGVSSRRRAAR